MDIKKILIIDDEEDFCRITKLNLEKTEKYRVLTLTGAKNLIRNLHEFRPDVILLDILMPSVGGFEACEMLNDDPVGRTTPIIIISALDKPSDKLRAFKLGVVDYLSKPVSKAVIISTIEKAIEYK